MCTGSHILLDIKLRLGRSCGCQIQICKSQPKGLKTIHFLPFKKQTFYCKALYRTSVVIHFVISSTCLHVEPWVCRGAFLCKELTITLRVDYTKRMALSNLSRSCISLGLGMDRFEFCVSRPFSLTLVYLFRLTFFSDCLLQCYFSQCYMFFHLNPEGERMNFSSNKTEALISSWMKIN